MRLLLDTNRYRDMCAGDPAATDPLQRAEHIFLAFVTLAALRAGFRCGTRGQKNESVLTRFMGRPRVSILYPDETTTHHYANLFRQLRTQGTPIPTNDLWVAALAVQHGLQLLSRDAHFDHLPQIPRAG